MAQKALIVIDVQNDFCPGGELAVENGDEIVPLVNHLIASHDHVVLTQDWHPAGHSSFASRHEGKAPFETIEVSYGPQTLWPDHCVQGSTGSEFHPELEWTRAEMVIRKGFRPEIDSYSAFFENDHATPTGLSGYLNEHKHAADFGSVAQYRDRRVLIVGAGNSAMDIANHLVRSGQCKSISVSTRSGGHILPTRFLGFPLQLMTPLLVRLPLKMQDRLVSLISTFCLGDLTKWNFNSPLEGVCSRLARQGLTPGFDEGCVAAIKSGEIKILPGIEQFNQQDVQFTNGETQAFDNVIFATGYRSGLESLLKPFDAVDSEGRPLVHAPEADASNPGLWLFGMQNKVEGNFLARQKEARKMARQIRKDQSSPRLEPAIQH